MRLAQAFTDDCETFVHDLGCEAQKSAASLKAILPSSSSTAEMICIFLSLNRDDFSQILNKVVMTNL